jgi:PHP family Zn ribbon phosphoesterase
MALLHYSCKACERCKVRPSNVEGIFPCPKCRRPMKRGVCKDHNDPRLYGLDHELEYIPSRYSSLKEIEEEFVKILRERR